MKSKCRQSARDEEEIFKVLEEGGFDAASEKSIELFTKQLNTKSEVYMDDNMQNERLDDRTLVKIALSIIDSEYFTWRKKYNLIFSDNFSRELMFRGVEIDWYDPDCDYEDDVRAYGEGLREWLKDGRDD